MTTPNTHTRHDYTDDDKPERQDPLGEIAFSKGGGLKFLAEYWPGRPSPSFRVVRVGRTGSTTSFSVSAGHGAALQSAVAAWTAMCTPGASIARPGSTSREERAAARLVAEQARRGGQR